MTLGSEDEPGRTKIKIDSDWPWAVLLAAAFNRLAEIRQTLLI